MGAIRFKYPGDATKHMGRSAVHGGIVVSLLVYTSELAGADGRINVESLCAGSGLKSGVVDFGEISRKIHWYDFLHKGEKQMLLSVQHDQYIYI